MNQNEIDLLFGRICSASEKLHYLRNKLYQFIKATDDGELNLIDGSFDCRSTAQPGGHFKCSHNCYAPRIQKPSRIAESVHDDFQVNANLVPLECLVSISDDLKLELQKIKENIYDVAKSLLRKQKGDSIF